jgi:methionyl aminopeptidase
MLFDRKLRLNDTERDSMRAASRFNAELLDYVRPHVKAGISTLEIDNLVHAYTVDNGHKPACLGYRGFPKSCCTSVNEVICHGIPGPYVLKEGDIVNVDLTTIVDGWFGDQSETFLVGEVSDIAKKVTQCAFDCLYLGIHAIGPNSPVSAIGKAIVAEAHKRGLSVVRDYVGHGIGRRFHQEPSIPHFPNPQSFRDRLQPGMCFTIEPMINAGHYEKEGYESVIDKKDGWTVSTIDNGISAQFEHTILMTEEGPEILTLTENGPKEGNRFE